MTGTDRAHRGDERTGKDESSRWRETGRTIDSRETEG